MATLPQAIEQIPSAALRLNELGASQALQEAESTSYANAAEDDLETDGRPQPTGSTVDWPGLVARIQKGDNGGMEELYRLFARGIRFYLCRQLGMQELDDKVHDTFLIVGRAIRRGDLRERLRLRVFFEPLVG